MAQKIREYIALEEDLSSVLNSLTTHAHEHLTKHIHAIKILGLGKVGHTLNPCTQEAPSNILRSLYEEVWYMF